MAPSAAHDSSSQLSWKDPDELRTDFTLALSAMYKSEVPLYGDLVSIVDEVNSKVSKTSMDPAVFAMRHGKVSHQPRLNIERHGAIRLGTDHELFMIRRVFAIIGLKPIGYYDLSMAGLPMHATCFRPHSQESLAKNPFRVFVSVLRPELLQSDQARYSANRLLSKRDIFSDRLKALLNLADDQKGYLATDQAAEYIVEAMKTFSWQSVAAASLEEYQTIQAEHPILADIACFNSCHVNHLTPRTLDIVLAQDMMKERGLKVKERIEGPPVRRCPILLRQTSFLAIEEIINFISSSDGDNKHTTGSHKARFGEIEERGAAVTPAGRRLYDQLLEEATELTKKNPKGPSPQEMERQVGIVFRKYPDSWDELRKEHLVYFNYEVTEQGAASKLNSQAQKIDTLIERGLVRAIPITYEDFLPLSAAGIFQSNLGASKSGLKPVDDISTGRELLKHALGVELSDHDIVYKTMESDSIARCASQLNVSIES